MRFGCVGSKESTQPNLISESIKGSTWCLGSSSVKQTAYCKDPADNSRARSSRDVVPPVEEEEPDETDDAEQEEEDTYALAVHWRG